MSDDIVTRLNYIASRCTHGLHTNAPEGSEVYVEIPCQRCKPLLDAADEIERLRDDLDRWKALGQHICEFHYNLIPEHIHQLFNDHNKAVRGE